MLLEGQPIHGLEGEAFTAFRGKVQAVFQDPVSLDPRMTVGRTIAESLIVAGWERPRIAARVEELLRQVRLELAHAQLYPHEFSGGQRQRVALAAALASRPKLIVLDEPISALDVSIRAQMMNLLKDIQAQDNVADPLVAHDLATVRHMADQTVVMYLGKVVEHAPTRPPFDDVRHLARRPSSPRSCSPVPISWQRSSSLRRTSLRRSVRPAVAGSIRAAP